ncbi:Clp protease N-terminal domain-containing protein [Euzebya tangerina]|uniref:Clp protease N-terminal domain-containing protein n=1 Tax=Euzebya tangerina TaxID=591198 RepID=UPI000E31B102|nr:Clp protease N-terminal domain-containing protein [Euzebya tangerina]
MTIPPYRLDDLIAAVTADGRAADPLGDVRRAVQTAEQLGELADHLVGHFVDEARRAGASWADIGANMGVTRQAAQQRFVPPNADEPRPVEPSAFDRWSEAARDAAAAAIERARQAQRDSVGGEDLFLGLLDQLDSMAEQAFEAFEVPLEQVREAALKAFGPPASPLAKQGGDRPETTSTEDGSVDSPDGSDDARGTDQTVDTVATDEVDEAHETEQTDGDDQADDADQAAATAGRDEGSAGFDRGSTRDEVWEAFERAGRHRGPRRTDELPPFPFGRDASRFIQMALREALRTGSGSVGPEHMLRGLLRDDTSPAWALLRSLGITREQAEEWLRDQRS